MKYVFLGMLFLGLSLQSANATHIIGGEISAQYVRTIAGEWEYEVSFWMYRDCRSNTPFDFTLNISVFDSRDTLYRIDRIRLDTANVKKLDVVVDNPCLTAPPNLCTELAFYQKRFRYPITQGGFTLTFERCCRNAGIVNIVTPGDVGSTYTVSIPGTSKVGGAPNSSAKFKNYPPLVLCLNDNIKFDHSAFDVDGDSLVYELCSPYIGGSRTNPYPVPAKAPPYKNLSWNPGYSGTNPLKANPALAIDSFTGMLTGQPTAIGQYVVGICVKEYRKGVLINQNTRDFQFNVTQCNPNSIAAASSQERFCDGLKVDFKNQSKNAIKFYWDFGDPNVTSDTSNLKEPTYTYADTGKYLITLIANPGYTCADTVYTYYEIYDLLDPYFARPPGQCFNLHAFNFSAGGSFESYAQFEWVFGPFGVNSGSFNRNPSNVKFTEPGAHPVTLFIRADGCEESYTDTVFIYPDPTSKFDVVNRSACVPAVIQFENQSIAWTDMFYEWDFGDGNTSSERSPVHTFATPGIYDVSLTTRTNETCSTAVVNKKRNYIKVNAFPQAALEADKTQANVGNPYITFKDLSVGNSTCKLDLGDGLESSFCDYTHYYFSSGKYTVRQVISSQFGCTDTNYLEILIVPDVALFIPNAFTPNNDTHNEYYKPYGEKPSEYDFWVYDRWGMAIFHTRDLDIGWDGYYKGEPAPNGNYIYRIKMVDVLGKEEELKGQFSLVR